MVAWILNIYFSLRRIGYDKWEKCVIHAVIKSPIKVQGAHRSVGHILYTIVHPRLRGGIVGRVRHVAFQQDECPTEEVYLRGVPFPQKAGFGLSNLEKFIERSWGAAFLAWICSGHWTYRHQGPASWPRYVVPHQGQTVAPAVAKARVRRRSSPSCVRGILVSWCGRREPRYATLGSATFKSSVIWGCRIYHVCAFFLSVHRRREPTSFSMQRWLATVLRQI
jgi:hypothetical protein